MLPNVFNSLRRRTICPTRVSFSSVANTACQFSSLVGRTPSGSGQCSSQSDGKMCSTDRFGLSWSVSWNFCRLARSIASNTARTRSGVSLSPYMGAEFQERSNSRSVGNRALSEVCPIRKVARLSHEKPLACQRRRKNVPARRRKNVLRAGWELVPVVHGRDPRAGRRALRAAGGGPRVGGACGPTGPSGGLFGRLPAS